MTRSKTAFAGLAVVIAAPLGLALPATPAVAGSAQANANAQGDLRNLATVEEVYFTDYGHYGSFAQLIKAEPDQMTIHRGVTVAIVHYRKSRGYCFRATTATGTFMYDALAGGSYVGKHCRKVTTGRYGGKRTGPATI